MRSTCAAWPYPLGDAPGEGEVMSLRDVPQDIVCIFGVIWHRLSIELSSG
jgi:hypothetical protein